FGAHKGYGLALMNEIIGAFIGGWIMNQFGAAGVTGFNLNSLLVAILGAIVLLFVVGLVRR
ncbi:MAG TPA: GlsB/YeaQ/YmgE family stress response membrane protein, partial [Anaerolineae bacterium]|nr:GlsB/YeaQ/YmgE family stress response membrane protein [Anaerolineae bacterium]